MASLAIEQFSYSQKMKYRYKLGFVSLPYATRLSERHVAVGGTILEATAPEMCLKTTDLDLKLNPQHTLVQKSNVIVICNTFQHLFG